MTRNPDRGGQRNGRAAPFQRLVLLASDTFIAAENGVSTDMRTLVDHDQVSDLRIAIDMSTRTQDSGSALVRS